MNLGSLREVVEEIYFQVYPSYYNEILYLLSTKEHITNNENIEGQIPHFPSANMMLNNFFIGKYGISNRVREILG